MRHDAAGWRALARDGRVFVSEVETDRDLGLSPLEAASLALAILEASYDAKRQAQPYHERREFFDDPIRAEIVEKYRAAKWPAELTETDWASIDAEWRARRDD